MLTEIGLFLLAEFLFFVIISFILKGSTDIKRFWEYFSEGICFAIIITTFFFLWNFSTFQWLDNLFIAAIELGFLTLAFIVFIAVIGIELGNLLEKIFIKRQRK